MKHFSTFLLMLILAIPLRAQNPYMAAANNEDQVIHLEQWQQHAARPLQCIVKLQDYSQYTIVGKPGDSGKSGNTGVSGGVPSPAIQAVLAGYSIESIEQLCPTFVMPKTPRRSVSYGGGEVRDHDLSQLYLITLREDSPKREGQLIEELAALPEVEYAEPNYLAFALDAPEPTVAVADATAYYPTSLTSPTGPIKSGPAAPNDPLFSQQWGFGACNLQQLLGAPKRDASWRPIIAIIDTGVDIDHPDLIDNIWTNSAEQNGAANQDDDNNGFRDDVHGWDFVNQTGDIHDFNSHGTHCAGIAGAVTGNGIGIAGACPDAWIMPVGVMQSDGSGDIATIVRGINYATQNGADVISMSIGSYAYSAAMEQALAVAYQTAVLVGAAGNDGLHIDPRCCGDPAHAVMDGPMFPGAFTFVLGVQATQQGGGLAGFSNRDCDGASYSQFDEEKLYNYELSAPGMGIMSTVPNGGYRSYNGTSMACPLVAGGVASLLQRREYLTKEILFGDLINYNSEFSPVDFWAVYNADSIAPAILQMVTFEVNDTLYGDSSMYADAGERVQIYPTIRTVWGPADSVELWLEFQEFEDQNTLEIMANHVLLGRPISSYAKAKSVNPIDLRIANNVVDGRKIQLTLCATSPQALDTIRQKFTLPITNGVKLHGMVTHNDTLWPNVQYIVTDNLAIDENATLVIKPGTTLKFKDNAHMSVAGRIYAVGTPDSMIIFTKTDLGYGWPGIQFNAYDTVGYAIVEYLSDGWGFRGTWYNQIFHDVTINNTTYMFSYRQCVLVHNTVYRYNNCSIMGGIKNCNIYNNYGSYDSQIFGRTHSSTIDAYTYLVHLANNNIINNNASHYYNFGLGEIKIDPEGEYLSNIWPVNTNAFNNNTLTDGFSFYTTSSYPFTSPLKGLYTGTSKESIARQHIYDFEYPNSGTFGFLDLTYMEQEPIREAHGIVWKVEVNGYDAQDEFDSIIPLGVGTHEFKVYFNRAMDTSITPMVAMGVRPPYTQTAISENAHWSADSTIYTAHLNLTGRMPIDGLNRIYVSGAQDNEHFEIPYENQRFNVYVASSGSMSAGFQATPGIGKVDLEWNDQEVNYDDFLGFNIYRYQYVQQLQNYHYNSDLGRYVYDTVTVPGDTIRLNNSLVQDTVFTDFDVTPGERYYYFYKILSTSLTENSPSKTVSCVPYSSIRGDANGSMNVDVADVITTINYVTGQNPQPFLFEAADVNGDGTINVLDIVGIINIILHPDPQPGTQSIGDPSTAVYTVEDGVLYVDSPVAMAGLQFTLGGCTMGDIEVLEALRGFECASVQNGSDLTLLFYSMSGATVPAGKTALLRIGEHEVSDIALSDVQGQNIVALDGDLLGMTDIEAVQAQFATAYPNPFTEKVTLELKVGNYRQASVVFTDMMGRTVEVRRVETPVAGSYRMTWDATSRAKGIYFATLYVDEQKAQTIKLIVK